MKLKRKDYESSIPLLNKRIETLDKEIKATKENGRAALETVLNLVGVQATVEIDKNGDYCITTK